MSLCPTLPCRKDNGDPKNKSPSLTHEKSITETVGCDEPPDRKKSPLVYCVFCLSTALESACFVSETAGKPFHSIAPLYEMEKHFYPLADVFFGNIKSVFGFRRLQAEFLVKRLPMHCGASPLIDFRPIGTKFMGRLKRGASEARGAKRAKTGVRGLAPWKTFHDHDL